MENVRMVKSAESHRSGGDTSTASQSESTPAASLSEAVEQLEGDSNDAAPAETGVLFGDAMTRVALQEVRRLCNQAVRHHDSGDKAQAAATLELAKGVMVPALNWLMQTSSIIVEQDGAVGEEQVGPPTANSEGIDELPGVYL